VGAPQVVVLDYGSGNLRSAQRALARVGADAVVSADPALAAEAAGLVVPGVGAFAACMAGLTAVGGPALLRQRVADARPVLGVCVGMQVLFTTGTEHGQSSPGVGLWPGAVTRLHAPVLPHIGWNTVAAGAGSSLLADGLDGERFYFVHSYAAQTAPPAAAAVSWTCHGGDFVAAVEDGALSATQFHPEKSGDVGAELLARWVGTL